MKQQLWWTPHPRRWTMWRLAISLLTLCALSHTALAQGVGVAGTVRYYSNDELVPDVAVQMVGGGDTTATTDTDGSYALTAPPATGFMLQPQKTGGVNGAVSALDAAWILQWVVGLRDLTDQQMIACDVTGDGTVSPLDAARILQVIIGLRSRLPVAETCGSDFAFVPDPASAPGQHVMPPQMAPMCQLGAIAFDQLLTPAQQQDFRAIAFGDCTGNWQNPLAPPPSQTATPVPTSTNTATVPPTATAPSTATVASTATVPPSATPTRTGTVTKTPTAPPTFTPVVAATSTRTASSTKTQTFTPSSTRTLSVTPTRTATSSGTPTRSGTRTMTPTVTYTVTPTPTPPCAHGLAWDVSAPVPISSQTGGNLWLTKTVPTDFGWGIFWLRQDPSAQNSARLYYAHVDFNGQITHGPLLVISIPLIPFRGRYYLAAWNTDHFGITVSDNASLYYYNMSIDGVLSGHKLLSVPLFTSTIYDQEADGDLDPFPGGFLGVIEGECSGHSCSYAFKLDTNGNELTSPINLVDFDLTHQFYPSVAFDGAGFAIITVKDIQITAGGVMTKYLPLSGGISSNAKVVPTKEYLWDEFPDIAWNGDHFAALWTENSARSDTAPWQIHFASFRRTKPASTLIAQRVIDTVAHKTNHRWTTQVHPAGGEWVAQYATRAADDSILAVYELLGDDAATHAAIEPFPLTADALGSSPHFAPGYVGTLGIARGSNAGQGTDVTFYTLAPPACAP